MFPDYKLGIEPIKDTDVPMFDQMRDAIYKGSRDSHLVRAALDTANYRGLSGEDKYVLLAYQALIHLEDINKRLMRFVSLTPSMPSFEIPAMPTGNEPRAVPEYPVSREELSEWLDDWDRHLPEQAVIEFRNLIGPLKHAEKANEPPSTPWPGVNPNKANPQGIPCTCGSYYFERAGSTHAVVGNTVHLRKSPCYQKPSENGRDSRGR